MTRSVAGTIGAAALAEVVLVSLAMAVRVHRFKARPIILVDLCYLIAGNLLAALMTDPMSLGAARILVGVGKGIVVTISFSLAAGASHPIRAFAILNASYALFSTVFFLTMPAIIATTGAMGCFAALSGVSMISLLAL